SALVIIAAKSVAERRIEGTPSVYGVDIGTTVLIALHQNHCPTGRVPSPHSRPTASRIARIGRILAPAVVRVIRSKIIVVGIHTSRATAHIGRCEAVRNSVDN